MPLQNRVLPTGAIVAIPERGLFTGNRGILAFDGNRRAAPRWAQKRWIICDLAHPRGRYHGPRPARGWTPLFFLDEAVALAAGHRPCAACRRAAFAAFRAAWDRAHGPAASADAIDRALHAARVTRARQQITHEAAAADLPPGCFVAVHGAVWLLTRRGMRRFAPGGYGAAGPRPRGAVTVLTPAPTVAALAAGFSPVLHPTANAPGPDT